MSIVCCVCFDKRSKLVNLLVNSRQIFSGDFLDASCTNLFR